MVCPAGFTLLSDDKCYKAMDVDVTYWKAIDVCTAIEGTAVMASGYGTEEQALRLAVIQSYQLSIT